MIIDFHSHLNPAEWAPAGMKHRSMFDPAALLQAQEEAGVDLSVISHPMFGQPPEMDLANLDALKRFHHYAAEIMEKYPGRLVALACAVPFEGDDFLKETERALGLPGFKGVIVSSSYKGEYLDAPRALTFFQWAAAKDVTIFVHPPYITLGAERMEKYRLVEMVGRPWDTTLSIARLILSGILEEFPSLRLVLAHVGGAITVLPGRLDYGYELRHEASFGPWEPDLLHRAPSYSIERLYVDTVSFHAPAVMAAIATLGTDRVVMGSDFPPVCVPLRRSVELIAGLPISQNDKAKILGGNAARLLKL